MLVLRDGVQFYLVCYLISTFLLILILIACLRYLMSSCLFFNFLFLQNEFNEFFKPICLAPSFIIFFCTFIYSKIYALPKQKSCMHEFYFILFFLQCIEILQFFFYVHQKHVFYAAKRRLKSFWELFQAYSLLLYLKSICGSVSCVNILCLVEDNDKFLIKM